MADAGQAHNLIAQDQRQIEIYRRAQRCWLDS
jgi:hypothetical protein